MKSDKMKKTVSGSKHEPQIFSFSGANRINKFPIQQQNGKNILYFVFITKKVFPSFPENFFFEKKFE